MDLTLQHLRTLREVAARGTIAAAADALGYTPSAISQQLSGLERTTGVAVLERVGRGVRLTPAGRELVRHAGDVLARVERAQAAIEEIAVGPCGDVRLAVFESFASSLLPAVARRLRAAHPDLLLRSVELDPDDALEALVTGDVDLALVLDYPHAPSPRPEGIQWQVLRRELFRLVVPDGDGVHGAVDLATLADRPFVAGGADTSCGRCTLNACREVGFEPDVHHEIDKSTATLRLVAEGVGVALLPDLALTDPPPGVRVVDLDRPVHRTIELAGRPAALARPAVAATVAAIVEATCRAPG